jgi:murein DD-endopeptidase MepM/ murein hydrolase activator NlpD
MAGGALDSLAVADRVDLVGLVGGDPIVRISIVLIAVAACSGAAPPPADHTTVDTLVGLAPDSATIPLRAVARSSSSPGDTSPITASPSELDELRASLIIPVQGVNVADIHDTYTEARAGHVHEALDIRAPRGTPVLSATNGRLLKLHQSVPGGKMVYAADATDRFILMYGHLDRYADGLTDGMPLKQGQIIGYVGTTGNAPVTTPHLHFALARGRPSVAWWRGTAINPFPLLARSPSATP